MMTVTLREQEIRVLFLVTTLLFIGLLSMDILVGGVCTALYSSSGLGTPPPPNLLLRSVCFTVTAAAAAQSVNLAAFAFSYNNFCFIAKIIISVLCCTFVTNILHT